MTRIEPIHVHRRSDGEAPLRLASLPPLSLYVHLPWCLRKCPYCDFNSHELQAPGVGLERELAQRYVAALLHDVETALPSIWGRTVHSIFMGGGTPSLFEPQEVEQLINGLRARLKLEPGLEITMEANPGTFERQRFAAYAQAGVTRLSIGVQSFSDVHLKAVGRVHDAAQARAAVEEAAQTFKTWNLDLMYALPGQSLQDLAQDLAVALQFEPPHLSVYHLTLEPNTRFAVQPPPNLPDDDSAYEMLDVITQGTQAAGLERYEVSAFSKPGHRCVHNLNYWRFGDYLGIGAGAHSKISFPDRIVRQVRWREPARYLKEVSAGRAVSNEHALARHELPFEFMLNGLRLVQGIDLNSFAERTGLSLVDLQEPLSRASERGLLEREGSIVRASAKGLDFLSDLQSLFL